MLHHFESCYHFEPGIGVNIFQIKKLGKQIIAISVCIVKIKTFVAHQSGKYAIPATIVQKLPIAVKVFRQYLFQLIAQVNVTAQQTNI